MMRLLINRARWALRTVPLLQLLADVVGAAAIFIFIWLGFVMAGLLA